MLIFWRLPRTQKLIFQVFGGYLIPLPVLLKAMDKLILRKYTEDKTKIPYYIYFKDRQTMPIVGLWNTWNDLAEPEREYMGVTLRTTSANELFARIHNQPTNSPDFCMPAILEPEEVSKWLDPNIPDIERLGLIRSYRADAFKAHSVVNYRKKATLIGNDKQAQEPYDHQLEEVPVELDGAKMV